MSQKQAADPHENSRSQPPANQGRTVFHFLHLKNVFVADSGLVRTVFYFFSNNIVDIGDFCNLYFSRN